MPVPANAATKTGVLLVNLGTPDAPRPAEVRRYLNEFLSDPRVIDGAAAFRFLLVRLVLLTRPAKSAAAYQKIWTDEGSPLLVHSLALRDAVASRLTTNVVLAMRYGSPSIATGLSQLHSEGCDRIVVLPLYPQYAASSTGSTLEAVYRIASGLWNTPYVVAVPPFFDHPAFVTAWTEVATSPLREFAPDHLLFSFHGLPERHMRKSSEGKRCLERSDCCEVLEHENRNCYRAQCYATARALARALERRVGDWSVSFQSRLGRDPWIKPWTDEVLPELARKGVRRLAVMCPAFVADCLETLEEIGIRAREDFVRAGGEDLLLVPSLNATPGWVEAVTALIVAELPGDRATTGTQ